MAMNKILVESFFEQFNSFLGELSEMYPVDSEFPTFKTYLGMLKMTNPKLVITYFNDNISTYLDKILARDESFFLEKSFEEYDGYFNMGIFLKLKTYIKHMSPETKVNVWQYIENITRLANAISPKVQK